MKLTFGKYRLVAELGQGGMADVILALSQGPVGFSKLVVIKRLRDHLADDPEFVGMLIDEARLAARLNHPNIVHTNEVGEIDGRFFMAMEYLEGQPFTRIRRRAKKRKTPLSLSWELHILSDVLAGLQYAHELKDYDGRELGVVHRDVTPSNVFVTYDGVVKLVDFGIAKATGRSTETKTGVVKGKMTYMPPEQALGQEVDRRADVFSVGVMLWEAVAGTRMWKGVEDVVVLGKLINGDIPTSPKEVAPDVPDVLDEICRRALAPDPNDRYASAADLQEAIDDYLETIKERPNNRDIGALVSELFDRDRKEIRQIIESQLSKLTDDGASSLDPVMIPDSMPSSRTPSATFTSNVVSETSLSPSVDAESSEPQPSEVSAAPPQRQRSVLWLGAALAAVIATIGYVVTRSPAEGTSPDADTTASPSTAAAAPPTASETATAGTAEPPSKSSSDSVPSIVRLTLRAVPASAQFSVDDGPWLDNPHVRRVAADDERHEIRVRAAGYETKKLVVPFDEDVVLDITLERSRRVGVRRPPKPAPPEPKAFDDLPAPAKPDAPPLLPGNPWDDEKK